MMITITRKMNSIRLITVTTALPNYNSPKPILPAYMPSKAPPKPQPLPNLSPPHAHTDSSNRLDDNIQQTTQDAEQDQPRRPKSHKNKKKFHDDPIQQLQQQIQQMQQMQKQDSSATNE